jgi:hypothetical protein
VVVMASEAAKGRRVRCGLAFIYSQFCFCFFLVDFSLCWRNAKRAPSFASLILYYSLHFIILNMTVV